MLSTNFKAVTLLGLAFVVSAANACTSLRSASPLYALLEYPNPTCSFDTGKHVLFPELDFLCTASKIARHQEIFVVDEVLHTPLDEMLDTTFVTKTMGWQQSCPRYMPFSHHEQCYFDLSDPSPSARKGFEATTVVFRSYSATRRPSHISYREPSQLETSAPRAEEVVVLTTLRFPNLSGYITFDPVFCFGTIFMMLVMGVVFSEL